MSAADRPPPSTHEERDLVFRTIFLDFSRATETRYEAETGMERVSHLRRTTLIGLIFYSVYQSTNMILMPDIMVVGLVLRILISLFSLGIVLALPHVSGQIREILVTVGMIGAYSLPIFLFWKTTDPLGLYSFYELSLMMVFGTMMLVLRFPHALAFIVLMSMVTFIALTTKPGLDSNLVYYFCFQTVTVAFFVLYGNYRIEAVRRRSYLTSLREILRAQDLEVDRHAFAQLSSTDALTGLSNRRGLDEWLAGWDALLPAQRPTLGVIMIDVDHFKIFNDTYGHLSGDDCLRRVAAALTQATVPDEEAVFRYGGEEFVVFVQSADTASLAAAGERLRAAVAALAIEHARRPDGFSTVTVSLGGVVRPQGSDWLAEDIFAAADQALYAAKRAGRNRCRIDVVKPRPSLETPPAAPDEERTRPAKHAMRA